MQFISGVIAQKFHNNLLEYCNSGGLKEHKTSAHLLGSIFRLQKKEVVTGTCQPIMGHFRECMLLLAVLFCASYSHKKLDFQTKNCRGWVTLHRQCTLMQRHTLTYPQHKHSNNRKQTNTHTLCNRHTDTIPLRVGRMDGSAVLYWQQDWCRLIPRGLIWPQSE